MRFGVLGSLTVWDDSCVIRPVGRPKPRALLAALLLEPNRLVPSDHVMAALWGERPPATATASLHNHAGWLRRALGEEGRTRLDVTGQGFVFRVEDGELDSASFERLVQSAQQALRTGQWDRAESDARAALLLWRGSPLADVPSLADHPRIAAFQERWLQGQECLFEALLQRGALDVPTAELEVLVKEHPFREAFHRQLMLVLHRGNRQAEALEHFHRLRRTLIDELGVEPGPAVQQAYQQILAEEPHPASPGAGTQSSPAPRRHRPPAPVPQPAQLPPAPAHFAGRTEEATRLRAALLAGRGQTALAVISGMAGVGKTGLARHVAHQLRPDFPSGQLYLNLRAATPGMAPMEAAQALSTLLRGLGVPADLVPADTAEASALLRSKLADTRTLLLLDDAASAAQVRPLLPAGSGCAALVTSRRPLTALGAAEHVRLAPLSPGDSALLLEQASGRTWSAADSEAVDELAVLCGRLPLALRIAGARLANRRQLTVGALSGRLAAHGNRLDHLELDDLSVRRSLAMALDALLASDDGADHDAACALRCLGSLDLPDYGVEVTALLMGVAAERAERALERLAEVALLEETSMGRYAPHDLVRDFAREVSLAAADSAGQTEGIERALTWHLDRIAGYRLTMRGRPRPDARSGDPAEAVAWAEQEIGNLVFLATRPGGGRLGPSRTVALVEALCPYLADRGHVREMKRLARHGMELARQSGDVLAGRRLLFQMAVAHYAEGHLGEALACVDEAHAQGAGDGDDLATMLLLSNRAELLAGLGRHAEALETLNRSLAIRPDGLSDFHEALVLGHRGNVIGHADPRLGISYHLRSLLIAHRTNAPVLQLVALCNAGTAHLALGEPAAAWPCFELGLRISAGGLTHWNAERELRTGLVLTLCALGRVAEAREACREFLRRAGERGDAYATGLAHYADGHVHLASGAAAPAHASWQTALRLLRHTDAPILPELRRRVAADDGARP